MLLRTMPIGFLDVENDLRKIWSNIRALLNCGNHFLVSGVFILTYMNNSDKSEINIVNIGSNLT